MNRASWSARVETLKAPWRDGDARRCLSLEFLWAAFFGTAIMQTYYEGLGLGQDKVNELQSWCSVVIVAAGIPGGWLADRFGVRRIMIAGTLVQLINSIFFAQCRTFEEFRWSLACSGITVALLAGTTSSLMTSTLGESAYKTYEWWGVQLRCGGQIAAIIGGYFMVKYGDLHLPYQCQPFVYLGCVLVTLRLRKRFVRRANTLSAKVMVSTAKEMLWHQPAVRYATLFFAATFTGMTLIFWLLQPRLKQNGVAVVDFGLLYLLKNVGTSLFGVVVGLWLRTLRIAQTLLLVGLCASILASAAIPTVHGAFVLFLAHSFASALYLQVQRTTFRELLPDAGKRTTELAVAAAFAWLYFAGLSWAFGQLTVSTSVRTALIGIATVTFTVGGLALWALHRAVSRAASIVR